VTAQFNTDVDSGIIRIHFLVQEELYHNNLDGYPASLRGLRSQVFEDDPLQFLILQPSEASRLMGAMH